MLMKVLIVDLYLKVFEYVDLIFILILKKCIRNSFFLICF